MYLVIFDDLEHEYKGNTYHLTPFGAPMSLLYYILERSESNPMTLRIDGEDHEAHLVMADHKENPRDVLEVWWLRYLTTEGESVAQIMSMFAEIPPPVWSPKILGGFLNILPFCSHDAWIDSDDWHKAYEEGTADYNAPMEGVIDAFCVREWAEVINEGTFT